jgi:uncharacterized membrane protein
VDTSTATARRQVVIGVYDTLEEAEQAIERLHEEGVSLEDVSIVGQGLQSETKIHGFVTTGDLAKESAGVGAFFGGLMGMLAGTAFLFVPGLGPLVVLGPLATTLAGAGEGALAGGIIGALFGKLVEKEHIPKLEQRVRAGKYLVVAHGDRAHEVIQGSAAREVETHDGGG